MIGRALDGEIERQFHAVRRRGVAQPAEIVERAEARVDRVMSALGAADRVGAARIAGFGMRRIVAALAVGPPDRMDRRKIDARRNPSR